MASKTELRGPLRVFYGRIEQGGSVRNSVIGWPRASAHLNTGPTGSQSNCDNFIGHPVLFATNKCEQLTSQVERLLQQHRADWVGALLLIPASLRLLPLLLAHRMRDVRHAVGTRPLVAVTLLRLLSLVGFLQKGTALVLRRLVLRPSREVDLARVAPLPLALLGVALHGRVPPFVALVVETDGDLRVLCRDQV